MSSWPLQLTVVSVLAVLPLSAGQLTRETKLMAGTPSQDAQLGRALGLSGGSIAAGAPGTREVLLIELQASRWSPVGSIVSFGAAADTGFGFAVDVDRDRLLVGAYRADAWAAQVGAAYLYQRVDGSFRPEARLVAPDGVYLDYFGWSVALDGDTAVVGAPRDAAGSAYVYRRYGGYWDLERKLVAADGNWGDQFGTDVAVSRDLIVVGVPSANASVGSAYVFRRTGGTWVLEQKLQGGDRSGYFGYAVAADGDVVVVAAVYSQPLGAVHVYRRRDDGLWIEEAKLTAHDGASQDNYGVSVSISGDTIVVGSHRDDDLGRESGSAYIYRYAGSSWVEDQKLTASEGNEFDYFGDAVAIDGEVVVAASPWADVREIRDAGSVYVYDGSGGANLPPIADAGESATVECDAPGTARVPLDGSGSTDVDSPPGTNDDIVSFDWFEDFNTPSEVWVAAGERTAATFGLGSHRLTLEAADSFGHVRRDDVIKSVIDTTAPFGEILSPPPGSCYGPASLPVVPADSFDDTCDPDFVRSYQPPFQPQWALGPSGSRSVSFGGAVSLNRGALLVGAPTAGQLYHAGAAHVFRRSGDTWLAAASLAAPQPETEAYFGISVAVSGDVAVVGAPGSGSARGAAHVFRAGPSGWSLEQSLIASDAAPQKRFGSAVSVDRDLIVVGAPSASAAYVFRRVGAEWVEESKLVGERSSGDSLGVSAAVFGDTVIVGASGDADGGVASGAAFVFRRSADGVWFQEAKLKASDAAPSDAFGFYVALQDDVAVVGTYLEDHDGTFNSGAAYVFRRDGSAWHEEAKLIASDGSSGDHFGNAAIDGDAIIVGSVQDDYGMGSAYVFRRVSGEWVESVKLAAPAGRYGDYYGGAVTVDGNVFAAGARGADYGKGAVYIKELNQGYTRHGDHVVSLTALDRGGNSATAVTSFTIDREPPHVEVAEAITRILTSRHLPFTALFQANDDDGAAGGVVRERLVLAGCPVLDGRSYGDGDGLLRDELANINTRDLCRSLLECGITELLDPEIGLEVEDCGGNAAVDTVPMRLTRRLLPGLCSGSIVHPPPTDARTPAGVGARVQPAR